VVFLTFGIATPFARQRAPLHKDQGPDTRSVVKGKPLDVKYPPRNLLRLS